MGRRKKEPKSTHREKIAAAASTLFMQKFNYKQFPVLMSI